MKKTIILYNPKAVFFDMPLALIALGTQVCEDYNVVIIDARIESDVDEILKEYIDQALLVGVTSLTGAPLKDAISFSKKVKDLRPELTVLWGGWHTSLFPKQILEEIKEVDITVQGQGEVAFKELVQHIENKNELEGITGIVFRKDGELVSTKPRPMMDINDLPRFNYDLIDVEKYFTAKGNRQFDFISSIGCFFRCTFCADPFVFGRKFSGLSPERIFEDLKYFHEKYQFDDLNFQDETFFTYPKKIVELANLLKQNGRKFSWAATMRADHGNRMSLVDFQTCKDGGLRRLLIGVESGSQEMMDWLKKDIKIEHVLKCAQRCKELDLAVIFPFIVGFPNETDESVEKSKGMIQQLSLMSPRFETPVFYFKPYPGTQITNDVVKSGEYKLPNSLEDWSEFDYIGSKGPWVSDEKFVFFERFKFYLRLARKRNNLLILPFSMLARWRVKKLLFKTPIEMKISEKILPQKNLS